MKLLRKRLRDDSIWTRELIPQDSVWRKELVPEDSVWGRDLLAFARKRTQCRDCPIMILESEHKCNHYERIPEDIWDGLETCPLYAERKIG
jgi:hypothetical protein